MKYRITITLLLAIASGIWMGDGALAQSTNSQCTKETDQQTLSVSGNTLTFPDACGTQTNTFELDLNGTVTTFTASISGVMRGGATTSLASTTGTGASVIINIAGGPFDKYTFTATWSGGTMTAVTVNRTASPFTSHVLPTLDLRKFPMVGNDMGTSLLAACNSLPGTGGIIDGRGVPTPWFIDSPAFGSQTCAGINSIDIWLPPGGLCYSVLFAPPAQADVHFHGAGNMGNGTNLVPNNPSGTDAALCGGANGHPSFPTANNAAVGGPFVTSWIGQNGLITINNATSHSSTITLTVNTTGGVAFPSNWLAGGKVLVTDSGSGKLDGLGTITTINNGTGNMTITVGNSVGATIGNGSLNAGMTIALANAVIGVCDGCLNAGTGFGGGYQWCSTSTYSGTWENLAFYGNGIPNFIPYYTCSKAELSLVHHVNFTHFSLAGVVRDNQFSSGNVDFTAHLEQDNTQFDTGTSGSNNAITQISTGTPASFTIYAGSSATYNYAVMTGGTFALTVAPVAGSTVYVSNTGGTADGGFYQVLSGSEGLANCTAPTTSNVCILAPGIAAHVGVAAGNLTLMTVGDMFEGFSIPGTGLSNPKISSGVWGSSFGTSLAGRSSASDPKLYTAEWIGSIKNGTYMVRTHNEDDYADTVAIGLGSNTVAAWGCTTCETGSTSLASLQSSNGITIQNVDYGGDYTQTGPGAGINAPSVVHLGKYAFANSLANICTLNTKNIFRDDRHNLFYAGAGASGSPEANCIGSYSQGTQFQPSCYVAGAGPACVGATSGISQIALSVTSVTVNTSSVTSKSTIDVYVITANQGGLTCNAVTNPTALLPYVSAVVVGTSFTITSVAPTGGTACYGWNIIN